MAENFRQLMDEIEACSACGLAKTRKKVVVGFGRVWPAPDVAFIGEAPGADEDERGVPFVGRAGKLLDEMLTSIDLSREDVFIANVLKCRPPQNRNPEPMEIAACGGFLVRQIRVLEPKIIVTLGNFATRFMLGVDVPGISKMHGQVRRTVNGRIVVPVYHPAAVLRNMKTLRPIMESDFQTIRATIDNPPQNEE